MDSFEYLIALVSVIAGLGITRALSGIARLIDARERITFSWIPFVWTASILLWLVAFWWFTFLLSTLENWSPFLHIFVLFYAGVIFFLLALLHPESIPDRHDMLTDLLNKQKMFFGTLMALGILDVIDTLIKIELGLSGPPMIYYSMHMAPWIGFSAIAMFVRNLVFHGVFAIGLCASFVVWLSISIDGIMEIVQSGL